MGPGGQLEHDHYVLRFEAHQEAQFAIRESRKPVALVATSCLLGGAKAPLLEQLAEQALRRGASAPIRCA